VDAKLVALFSTFEGIANKIVLGGIGLMVVIAGGMWLFSGGAVHQVERAKQAMVAVVIGTAIVALADAFATTLQTALR